MIPPRALSFQYRAEADRLRAAVDTGGSSVLSQVLSGTGGVGKTQLAADYARTVWESGSVDVLVWISATSRQAITAGYAQAGIEVLAADPGDAEQAARAFLAWLEPKHGIGPCRWMVVLDDLADLADLRGLWPPSGHGRTLITTRRREAALSGQGRRFLHVGMFAPREAAAYLTAVLAAHGRAEPADQINALAEDLGYLPLALAQAAAYLIDAAVTCIDYRRLLAGRLRKLADLLPEPSALPDDQAVTVAATWSLSIERADRLHPAGLARPMIQLVAMLDPNGMPQGVLTGLGASGHLADRVGRPVQADDAAASLRVLHRLSLIDHFADTTDQAVRVHKLIQRATRDSLTPSQHDSFAVAAARAIDWDWPKAHGRGSAQVRITNIDALTGHAEDALWRNDAYNVFFLKGSELGTIGLFSEAADHFQRLAATARLRLGPDHSQTLAARSWGAHWRGMAGDPAGAAAELAEVLADRERVQGSALHSLDVRTARSHLAHWQGRAGDPAGAAATLEEVLTEHTRGALRTLTSRAIIEHFTLRLRLSSWKGAAGDPAGAVAELTEILTHFDRTYPRSDGLDFVFAARHHRAHWRGVSGDPAGAVAELAELLADRERVQGQDHLEVLVVRHHRAHWRGLSGDPAGAVAELAEVLADRERVLGESHSYSQMTRSHLAYWRGAVEEPARAASPAELLPDLEQTLPG